MFFVKRFSMFVINLTLILIFVSEVLPSQVVQISRTFEVDYENNQFLMNGEPFRYASGELHYFRVPRPYWKDRLQKLKAAGLNTISTYIEWSQHEPSPGQYIFTEDLDIVHFIKLAQEVGLFVILRPGPYICAERDFGGYPSWLLSVNPYMKLRTSDPSHTFFIERWFKQLMPKFHPLLYGNGGPIIMVQVENEYGSYPVNDQKYLSWLRDLYQSYTKDAAVLFTTDGSSINFVTRGHIPGVFATIDFAPDAGPAVSKFNALRTIQPKGPLVNSEFYAGWLSYWGENFAGGQTNKIISTLDDMLSNNISFNFYMFHGGTNFGFTAGSGSLNVFQPDITSYDYDAPISEAGDLTSKYLAIQEVMSQYYEVDKSSLKNSSKGDYGPLKFQPVVSLFKSPSVRESVVSEYPLSFEQIGQRYGFVAYETTIKATLKDPSVLQVNIRDRAIVYLEEEEVSVLQYTVINETPLPPSLKTEQKLTLLVENMGRRNYQMLSDCTKGVISNATLDGVTIKNWKITGYPLSSSEINAVEELRKNMTTPESNVTLPAFYSAEFQIPEGVKPLDTFLDTSNWGKGVAFVNGFNLGRYWHIGPQVTLYVPGCYLRPYPMTNIITILELHFVHPDLKMTLVPEPYLNKPITGS